jgi:TPP-dependent pyruvate/acetoin dehydrogenase alpha subunit
VTSLPPEFHSSATQLISAWRMMVLIRHFENLVGRMSQKGDFKTPIHLGVGQEAIAVAVADSIDASDRVFGNHRSHGHYLALGGSPKDLFAEILGRVTGCSRGRGGSMHITAPKVGFMGSMPIVAGTIPVAVGAALGLRNSGAIAVAFFGDGATEEGVFHESLNIAAKMQLPILFVCENNEFSSHLHIDERQPDRSLTRFAEANRISHEVIDGNNYITSYDLLNVVVTSMRDTGKPFFVEAKTYRLLGHVGAEEDTFIGLHRVNDLEKWKGRDPIKLLGNILEENALLPFLHQEDMSIAIQKDLEKLYDQAFRDPWPEDLFRYEIQ